MSALRGHLEWIRTGKRPDGTAVSLPPEARRAVLRHFAAKPEIAPAPPRGDRSCVHLGGLLRTDVCRTCGRKGTPAAVFACAKHGECTLRQFKTGVKTCCVSCPDFAPAERTVQTWAVGITTAPRQSPTLERTLATVRAGGWQPVVYAEPDSPVPDGVPVVRRAERLGAWRNWIKAAEQLLAADTSHVLILQDDVDLCGDAKAVVESADWPSDVGCLSLYTSAKYHREGDGLHAINLSNFWGACALAFRRDALDAIVKHPKAAAWNMSAGRTAKSPEEIQQIDTAVGRILSDLGLKMMAWSPSLAQHTGDTSTISAKPNSGNRRALRWRGQQAAVASDVHFVETRRVSVVITARNYGRFLPEAIESALAQTVPCDVVYSDDFSTDNSVEIARRYEDRGVIVLSAASHRGVAVARNRGASAASGDYLIHLDGDDVLTPTFAADHLAAMAPGVPFAYGPAKAFGEGPRAGKFWKVPEWDVADIWSGNSVNTSAMYARWAFDAAGGWRDGIGTMWDWDLALRASRFGTPRASGAVLLYRQHPESWSHQFREFDDGVRPGHQLEMRKMNARLSIGSIYSGRVPGLLGWSPQDSIGWIGRIITAAEVAELPVKPDLTILDNSTNQNAAATLRRTVGEVADRFAVVRIVPHPERFTWTTEIERRDRVAEFMARACNRLLSFSRGDILWIVEDDVLVPVNACHSLRERLAGSIDGKAYGCPHAATGAYRTRHGAGYYVAGWHRGGEWPHVTTLPTRPAAIDYSGTGCLMFWRDRPAIPKAFRSHYETAAAHDWAWGMELKSNGGTLLFDPGVKCGHAQSESEVLW